MRQKRRLTEGKAADMNNFTYSIPTVVHFGRGQIKHLRDLSENGTRVLLVYGKGSVKKNGIYDRTVSLLKEKNMEIFELPGVEPNPHIQLVRRGVKICRDRGVEMILAVGGGSTIDCAKLVAAGVCYEGDPWDLMMDSSLIRSALPVYCVLTLAATGSEMDNSAVISDPSVRRKMDIASDWLKPVMSILDPEYTFSVTPAQTAAGAADIMSHIFESYFHNVKGTDIQSHLAEALLKTVIQCAPVALREPRNYDARANLMWCSSLALNGILSYGAEVKWCVHPIEHELSAYYNITHGEGLAILTPVWMEYVLSDVTVSRFAAYGRNVWGISPEIPEVQAARLAIAKTGEFFRELGLPSSLHELGIDDRYFDEMAENCLPFCEGCYVPLTLQDIKNIYRKAL